jgi:catechol 2,3-dioxygenase-like lactoylglutathione lyase family enzyme
MRLNHVTLACADVARSLAFYEGLGLRAIVKDVGEDGVLRYVRFRLPEGEATLSLERDGTARDTAPRAGGATISGATIYLECADVDARVAALAAAGYAIGAPETKPWLWREAELRDPDGHRLLLYRAGTYRLDPPWRIPGSPGPDDEGGERDADADIAPFASARNRGFADVPIPSARDGELAAFLEALIAGGPAERDRGAARLGPAYTSTLLAFGERMATRAARAREPRAALLGLVAVGLAWRQAPDVRAALPVLAVLYDAAARAGADPAALFADAGALMPADVAPLFPSFLTRGDLDEIAAVMGFAAGEDRDGFRYRRLWGAGAVELD